MVQLPPPPQLPSLSLWEEHPCVQPLIMLHLLEGGGSALGWNSAWGICLSSPCTEFIQSLACDHMHPCTAGSPLDYSLIPPDSFYCSHTSSSGPWGLSRTGHECLMRPTGAGFLGFLGPSTVHTLPALVLESATEPCDFTGQS